MKKIIITRPEFFAGEIEQINTFLSEENIRLHVRKPAATEQDYENLLSLIEEKYLPKIVLHDFYHLQKKYAVGGFHFSTNKRDLKENLSAISSSNALTMSTSCHSIEEVQQMEGKYDYVFLSPLFPSISKPGYEGNFDIQQIQTHLTLQHQTDVIALGGITPNKIKQIEAWDFDGYAMLGAAWV